MRPAVRTRLNEKKKGEDMKFWLSMMAVPELDQLPELARCAEECGFYGATYADHLVMPANIASKYPYTPDGELFWPLETPWPDPWITLTAMAAVTTRLRFATNIYLAALRDPFTAARAVSTAATFSNDRVVCGVSVGWLKEEYDAAGVDFHTRGRRLDELITVMRKLWTGEVVRHEGQFFRFDDVIMRPAPGKPVPVWSGGMAKPALRRAATNDGWLGLPLNVEDNLAIVAQLRQMRSEAGLPETGFDPCISLAAPLDDRAIDQFRAAGIEHMTAMPWMPSPWDVTRYVDDGADVSSLEVKKTALRRFSEAVIQKYA